MAKQRFLTTDESTRWAESVYHDGRAKNRQDCSVVNPDMIRQSGYGSNGRVRTFLVAFVVGLAAALLLALIYPYPEQVRYRSLSSALPDGGRAEKFLVELPGDRLLPRLDAQVASDGSANVLAELFRIRDEQNRVIGLAGKLTGDAGRGSTGAGQVSDWIVAISGRGALKLTQRNSSEVVLGRTEVIDGSRPLEISDQRGVGNAVEHRVSGDSGNLRSGIVVSGTGEFGGLSGSYDEIWQVEDVSPSGEVTGTIMLTTRIMGSR
jgi:hypothetical protein